MTGGAVGSLDRAVLPPHQRRAEDAAGRGRGGRHVGDIRHAGRRGAAGGRAAAVRVEAAQPRPGGARQRDRGGRATLPARARVRSFRSRAASRLLGAAGAGCCVVPALLAGALSAAPDRARLRFRGPVRPAADPLDVVAASAASSSASAGCSSRGRSASATTTIGELLRATSPARTILGMLMVKAVIWSSRSVRAPRAACWRRC